MTVDVTPSSYRDRRGGLVFFGLLQLGLGAMALLMTALMCSTFFMASSNGARGRTGMLPPRTLVPIIAFYLAVAVWFIVLGAGSMIPRRWAYALTLVQSWAWLIFGGLTAAMMLTFGSRMMPVMPAGQESGRAFVFGCMAAMMGIFFLALPLAFVLFYRSPHVKATVFAGDPQRRWTDTIPPSVLGLGLMLVVSAAMIVIMSGRYRALPIGSTMIRGWAASAIFVAFAALSAFSGVQLLRLERSGWWGTVVIIVLSVGYGFLLNRTDTAGLYEAMGFDVPRQDFDRIADLYRSPMFLGWLVILWVAYAGFLLYVRRYFFPGRISSSDADPGHSS